MKKKMTVALAALIFTLTKKRQRPNKVSIVMRRTLCRHALSIAVLASLASWCCNSVHAQGAQVKSPSGTAPQPFVDCGHPYDAENPNINTKPCENTAIPPENAPGGGNGASDPDASEVNSALQEQCVMLGITLERTCQGLATTKARQQCIAQVQKKVSTCEQGIPGASQGGSSAPGGSPESATRVVTEGQAACSSNYQKNFSYCKTLTDAKTAASCRALSADTFQRCSQGS
jgi:hypothetical protein